MKKLVPVCYENAARRRISFYGWLRGSCSNLEESLLNFIHKECSDFLALELLVPLYTVDLLVRERLFRNILFGPGNLLCKNYKELI